MDKKLLYPFLNKPVKIKLSGNFILEGRIEQISDDYVVFTTLQKSSILHHSQLLEIIPL